MAAIVLTGGQEPDPETIQKANEEAVPILLWPESAFEFAGRVCAAGVIRLPG
jgi:predicted transcriptional regulator